jgi:hypothetical protein
MGSGVRSVPKLQIVNCLVFGSICKYSLGSTPVYYQYASVMRYTVARFARGYVRLLSFCRSSRGVSRISRPLRRRSGAGVARRSICCVDCMCARMACGVVGGPARRGTFRPDARVVPGVVLALPFPPRGAGVLPEEGAGVVGFSTVLWSLPRALSWKGLAVAAGLIMGNARRGRGSGWPEMQRGSCVA